ncbi:MAG TPA: type IX secretion system membrane protein PorP/SprF [Prolixibacteraceae bacterium]|nr:type IX secretion system membrane protein PorP/SprF [Prolixibacteraceae bacterium]
MFAKRITYQNNDALKLFVLALMLLCVVVSKAQQDPVYTQYMNNISSLNPAYTNVRGVASLVSVNRKQWINFDKAPFTSALNYSMPIDSLGKMGGGFDFLYDNTHATTFTNFFADYAYQVKTSSTTTLSFGLKAGFNYLQPRLTELDRYHLDDPYILAYGDVPRLMPNFGVGVFWFAPNYYLGFSVPRLLRTRFHRNVVDVNAASRLERHYFFHAAYIYNISPSLVFKPGVATIVAPGAPFTADFDFSFMYADQFWLGAMYRISDAVGAYAHFQYENIKIGVSYEYPLTDLGYYTNGTVEILLRFDFKTKETQVFPSPSF